MNYRTLLFVLVLFIIATIESQANVKYELNLTIMLPRGLKRTKREHNYVVLINVSFHIYSAYANECQIQMPNHLGYKFQVCS